MSGSIFPVRKVVDRTCEPNKEMGFPRSGRSQMARPIRVRPRGELRRRPQAAVRHLPVLAVSTARAAGRMRTVEPASVRRMKILRQVAYAPEGLRINDVRGYSNQTSGEHLRSLAREGLVEAVPIRPGATSSNRPICKYVITEAGRAALVKEST